MPDLNGEADHVHLLLALPPNLDLSVFVNNLKTTSSRLWCKEFVDKVKRVTQTGLLVPLLLHYFGPVVVSRMVVARVARC